MCGARIGDEFWRISSPAPGIPTETLDACRVLHGIHHLPDRMAVAGSEVESPAFPALQEVVQGTQVCFGEVGYVYVVADCRAVWRRIIRAVNLHMGAQA